MERLRQGPGEAARQEAAPTLKGPTPSRWTLRTIRATFKEIHDYSLSGVWRWLRRRVGVKLRSARVQQYSPDPQYNAKVTRLKRRLREAARQPNNVAVLFLDEMGLSNWPEPAPTWMEASPAPPWKADRGRANNGLWRVAATMDAWTGRVIYIDDYIVGRKKLSELYGRIAAAYPHVTTTYVVQDNWSIHRHPDVLEALHKYPQIKPVWLPTYAPWLNPIEKLWRWLKETILKMHRMAAHGPALLQRVRDFLDQFARRSKSLLHYVGLLGDGQLAHALHPG